MTLSASTDQAGRVDRVNKRQRRQEQRRQHISAIRKPVTEQFIMSRSTINIEVFNLLNNGSAKQVEDKASSQNQAQSEGAEAKEGSTQYTASLLHHIYHTQTIRDNDAQSWSSIHNAHLRYWAYGSPPATVVAGIRAKKEKNTDW